MAKNRRGSYIVESKSTHYLILFGVVLLLIGFIAAVFFQQVAMGIALELIGTFISAVGLSKHSLRILKKAAGRGNRNV